MDTLRGKCGDSLPTNDLDLSCFKQRIGERGSSESSLSALRIEKCPAQTWDLSFFAFYN